MWRKSDRRSPYRNKGVMSRKTFQERGWSLPKKKKGRRKREDHAPLKQGAPGKEVPIEGMVNPGDASQQWYYVKEKDLGGHEEGMKVRKRSGEDGLRVGGAGRIPGGICVHV